MVEECMYSGLEGGTLTKSGDILSYVYYISPHYQIPFLDLFCVGYMLCELVIREERTQIAGCVSITDATGFGLKQVRAHGLNNDGIPFFHLFQMRAIGLEDGKIMASFFNISFPLWLRQSHVLHAPR